MDSSTAPLRQMMRSFLETRVSVSKLEKGGTQGASSILCCPGGRRMWCLPLGVERRCHLLGVFFLILALHSFQKKLSF